MATGNLEDSYFSCSTSAMDDGSHPPSSLDERETFFGPLSGCNTPTTESSPVIDNVSSDIRGCEHQPGVDAPRNDHQRTCTASDNTPLERRKSTTVKRANRRSVTLSNSESGQAKPAAGYFSADIHASEGNRENIYQAHSWAQGERRGRRLSRDEPRDEPRHSILPESEVSDAVRGLPTASAICIERPDECDVAAGSVRRNGLPWRTRTAPIVDAYNPSGIPGSAATLGKYYPSNYEASVAAGSPLQSPGASSESPVPLLGTAQECRLRQYQRDMISQTLLNARGALARTMTSPASIKAVERVLSGEGSRRSTTSGFDLLRRYKPSSPRITPLLSPGPVTPMALDENAETDYLTVKGVRPPGSSPSKGFR